MAKTKRKIKFKPIVKTIMTIVVLITCVAFSKVNLSKQICTDVIVSIQHDETHGDFITAEDVYQYLNINRSMLIGKMLDDITCDDYETTLRENPFVKHCEIYHTFDGIIHIEIEQRRPIVRIYSPKQQFYLDEDGYELPLSTHCASHVLVATGDIFCTYTPNRDIRLDQSKELQTIYVLAKKITSDTLFCPMMEQINIRNKNITLIPKIGPQYIELGKFGRDVDEKFKKLKTFYFADKVRENWHQYTSISLKYKNQIVCEKVNKS